MSFLDFLKNLFSNNKKDARIITADLSKTFGEKDPLEVGLFEGKTALPDKNVNIKINGVTYSRKTDENGVAHLNINLPVGEYEPMISFVDDDYNYTSAYCKVTVNPVITTQDMKMTEHDGSQFIAIASSVTGVRLSGVPIVFTVNGGERMDNRSLFLL